MMKKKTFSCNFQKLHEKSINRYRLTVLRVISIFLALTLICLSETSTATNTNGMLILTEKTNATKQNTQSSNLYLEMIETSIGVTVSVHYNDKENKEKPKQTIDNLIQPGLK